MVEGTTSIENPFNISELINKELIRLSYEDSEKDIQPVNIIDLIEYNRNEKRLFSHKEYYTKHIKQSSSPQLRTPVISDEFYGMSDNTEKSYIMLSNYISHTLFESNLCKEVTISMSSNEPIYNINEDNIDLFLSSSNLITTLEWTKSLVLDIFPFELKSIIEDMDLSNFNYENMILNKGELPYQNRRKLKDIVLM